MRIFFIFRRIIVFFKKVKIVFIGDFRVFEFGEFKERSGLGEKVSFSSFICSLLINSKN